MGIFKGRKGTHFPHAGEHLCDTSGGDRHADNDVGLVDPTRSDGAQTENERRARKGEEAERAWGCDVRNRCVVRIMVAAHSAEEGWDAGWGWGKAAMFIKSACHVLDVSYPTGPSLNRRLRSRVRLP